MDKTKDKLAELKLTKRQILFCLFYLRDFDVRKAAYRAGIAKKDNAAYVGTLLLGRKNIKEALEYLKGEAGNRTHVELTSIVDLYTRIAFADYSEYVKYYKNEKEEWVSDIDFEEVDGQLIDEISASKTGVKIKFLDRFKALEKLEKLMGNSEEMAEDSNNITVITAVQRPERQDTYETD